jgi:hypothetical protein
VSDDETRREDPLEQPPDDPEAAEPENLDQPDDDNETPQIWPGRWL